MPFAGEGGAAPRESNSPAQEPNLDTCARRDPGIRGRAERRLSGRGRQEVRELLENRKRDVRLLYHHIGRLIDRRLLRLGHTVDRRTVLNEARLLAVRLLIDEGQRGPVAWSS